MSTAADPTDRRAVDSSGRCLALGMGLVAAGIFLLTTRGVQVADNLVHADTAIGLSTRGSPTLSFDPRDAALALRRADGRVVSSLGPGLPLVSAPLVALGAGVRRLTKRSGPDGLPSAMAGVMERARRRTLIRRFRTINEDPRILAYSLVNPILGGATVMLVVWLALALGLSRRAAAMAGALLGLGSPWLVYAGSGWTQPLVAFSLTASAAALVRYARAPTARLALAVGATLGLAVLTRLDALVYALPLGALFGVVLWRARSEPGTPWATHLGLAAAPLAAALGAWLGWNLWRFGHPVGPAEAWQTTGWRPGAFFRGMAGLLASPQEGLVLFAPFALLAPWGALRLRREGGLGARLAIAALAVLALQVLLYGAWWDWKSNLSWGPRYLVPSLPLLALVAAALWDRAGRLGRGLLWAALGLGLLVQIPGVLLGPLKLPEMAGWSDLSFGMGYVALFGGHFDVPGSGSIFGGVVDCRSGASPLLALIGLSALALGAAVLWRRGSPRSARR